MIATKEVQHSYLVQLRTVKGDKIPYYFKDPISGKITFRRTIRTISSEPIKIHTGETLFSKARDIVEVQLENMRTGKSEMQIRREKKGVKNPLLAELWNECIAEKSLGKMPATVRSYNKSWNIGLGPFYKSKTLNDLLNPATQVEYKQWYLKTHPERLFEKTYVHKNMFLEWLVKKDFILKKPDISILEDIDNTIKQNTQYEKGGRVYSNKESEALIAAADKLEFSSGGGVDDQSAAMLRARAKCAILMGREGGGRKMEILSTPKTKIDFAQNRYWLWSTKNRAWRELPMTPRVRAAIKAQLKATAHLESQWLFPMPTNPKRHITGQIFDKIWNRCKAVAGFDESEESWFHDLRRTFATQTGEEGWSPQIACELLDMSLDTYMSVYCKPGSASKQALMKKAFRGKA